MPDSYVSLDDVVLLEHPFETDLKTVVVINHQAAIEGVIFREQRQLAETEEDFASEDPDMRSSVLSSQEYFFSEVRKAANNLAIVGVVTRLQHWAEKYAQKVGSEPTTNHDSLVPCLKQLNHSLGVGPIPIAFFEDLVTVRDSVIHADGKAKWTHRRPRTVAKCYSDGWKVDISEEQVKEAISKAIEQIKWYGKKIYRY